MRYGMVFGILISMLLSCTDVFAQGHTREHTVKQSDGAPDLVRSRSSGFNNAEVSIRIEGDYRIITANGLPNHETGSFPNSGNPSRISVQSYAYKLPVHPKRNASSTDLGLGAFGIAVNGIPFDPGAAEFYRGNRNSPWRYEALSGAIALGIDESHAHVQPTGSYHYHGLPNALLKQLKLSSNKHSPLIGWALDGFPIYARYGYRDAEDAHSGIKELRSSYQLKSGQRPSDGDNPGGVYDGTFVFDYEFKAGTGDLDKNNGRFCVTPEFPQGTYAYFLTSAWPVIPRSFAATPVTSSRGQQRGHSGGHGHEHGEDHDHGHGSGGHRHGDSEGQHEHPPRRPPPGRRPPPPRH